jgi:hypothetical protein
VGTNRVLTWPLVSPHVTARNTSVQAISHEDWRCARLGLPPTEPKVRGSNPLGRAPRLGRSCAFAGTSLLPRRCESVARKPVRDSGRVSGEFLASSARSLTRARCVDHPTPARPYSPGLVPPRGATARSGATRGSDVAREHFHFMVRMGSPVRVGRGPAPLGTSRRVRRRCARATVIPILARARAGTLMAPGDSLEWVAYPLPDV